MIDLNIATFEDIVAAGMQPAWRAPLSCGDRIALGPICCWSVKSMGPF
jgi:hypothetical protein